MSDQGSLPRAQRTAQEGMPRSSFLRRLGGAIGILAGGTATGFSGILTAGNALAAGTKVKAATSTVGVWLGNVRSLRPNQSLSYTDPKSGDPAVFIRLANGHYVSYDAVCTHAGCTVPYNPAQKLLVCPCHGARYDPARGAAVVSGPAPQPLARLPIRVDAAGNAYALDAKPGPGKPTNRFHQPPPPSRGDDSGENDDGGTATGKRKHRRKTSGDD